MALRTRSLFIKLDLASNSNGLHTILGRGDFITQTGTKPHIYIEAEWTLYQIQAAVRPLQIAMVPPAGNATRSSCAAVINAIIPLKRAAYVPSDDER